VLEEADYPAIRKGAVGRRPRTWLSLTSTGRATFARHMAALTAIADTIPRPADTVDDDHEGAARGS
jgi:hypothetical protein